MRKSVVLPPLALMAGSVRMSAESARIEIVLDVSRSMRSSRLPGQDRRREERNSPNGRGPAGRQRGGPSLLRIPGGAGTFRRELQGHGARPAVGIGVLVAGAFLLDRRR